MKVIHSKNLLNWRWYHDINCRLVFTHLLLNSSPEARYFGEFELFPGQLIYTLNQLSEEVGISVKALRIAIEKMQKTGCLRADQRANRFTLYTIENYGNFVSCHQENTDERANQRQTNGKPTANQRQAVSLENPEFVENFDAAGANQGQTDGDFEKGFPSFPSLSSPLHSSPILPQTPFPKNPLSSLSQSDEKERELLEKSEWREKALQTASAGDVASMSYALEILPKIREIMGIDYSENRKTLAPIARRLKAYVLERNRSYDGAKAHFLEVVKWLSWKRSPDGGNFVAMAVSPDMLFGGKLWDDAVLQLKNGKFVKPEKPKKGLGLTEPIYHPSHKPFNEQPKLVDKGIPCMDGKTYHKSSVEKYACENCAPKPIERKAPPLLSASAYLKKSITEKIEGGENV